MAIDVSNFSSATYADCTEHNTFINGEIEKLKRCTNKLLGLDGLVATVGGGANGFMWACGVFGFWGLVIHPTIFVAMSAYYLKCNGFRFELAKEHQAQLETVIRLSLWMKSKDPVAITHNLVFLNLLDAMREFIPSNILLHGLTYDNFQQCNSKFKTFAIMAPHNVYLFPQSESRSLLEMLTAPSPAPSQSEPTKTNSWSSFFYATQANFKNKMYGCTPPKEGVPFVEAPGVLSQAATVAASFYNKLK